MARGDLELAKRDLESAVAGGHRVARVDLGRLLSQPSSGPADVQRAVALYERAWADGVSVAGFELGSLYERGTATASDGHNEPGARMSQAWAWFRRAADVGEPNALARIGDEKVGTALTSGATTAARSTNLLDAFYYYAVAAERARIENWPDDAWSRWRYRRASLARFLAREGMASDVVVIFTKSLADAHRQADTDFVRRSRQRTDRIVR